MNQLSLEKRAQIYHLLAECTSLRAISRLTDTAINTVMRFSVDVGRACEEYQQQVFQNLEIEYIECDEIWSFVGTKEDHKLPGQPEGWGSVFTWTSIDPKTRLMPCWHVGGREASDAYTMIQKLKYAIKDTGKRLQIATDGNKTYLPAIEEMFGKNVDYMMFTKQFYGEKELQNYSRYSMPRMKSCERRKRIGEPDAAMSTNHVERSNLTIRTHSRRFVRMTNAFSRKFENHRYNFAGTIMYYNFCKIHSAIRCTPAMEAGITDHIWTPAEVVSLMYRQQNAAPNAA